MSYPDVVLALNPVGYWRLGEASGVSAVPLAGPAGTYINGPTLGIPGAIDDGDTAILGDGTSGLSVPTLGSLATWTVQIWAQGDVGGDYHFIFVVGSQSVYFAHMADDTLDLFINGGWNTDVGSLSAAEGWVLLSLTYDGTSVRLYKDDALVWGPFATPGLLNGSHNFGHDNGGSGTHSGIDEPAIYNYALSAEQVAAVFAAAISSEIGLTGARLELAAVIAAAGVRVAKEPTGAFTTPCVRLHPASPWLAASVLAAGRRTQRWEVWAVLGRTDSRAQYRGLERIVSLTTAALDGLQGWSAIEWERPAPTDMGGTTYLAARGTIETIKEV